MPGCCASPLTRVDAGTSALLPAIENYEAALRKYGFETVGEAVRNTRQAISRNPVGRSLTRTFFRVCGAVPAIRRATLEDSDVYDPQPVEPAR